MLFFLFQNVKLPIIVGILTFMSMTKVFITSGPGLLLWKNMIEE